MKAKVTKKLNDLSLNTKQVIEAKKCEKMKGGGRYWCCTRNKFISY